MYQGEPNRFNINNNNNNNDTLFCLRGRIHTIYDVPLRMPSNLNGAWSSTSAAAATAAAESQESCFAARRYMKSIESELVFWLHGCDTDFARSIALTQSHCNLHCTRCSEQEKLHCKCMA